jgi:hypothetical protein
VRAEEEESNSEDESSHETYEDATQEDDTEMGQSADVITAFHFPADPATRRFAAGSPITILIGFRNNGDQYLNVSSVGGHLLSPYDANFGIQNYTRREFGVVVPPGREVLPCFFHFSLCCFYCVFTIFASCLVSNVCFFLVDLNAILWFQGTFEYIFRPDKSLEANEYPFVADIVYFSSKKVYRNIAFNHTIELTEQSNVLNSLGVSSWFVFAGVGGVIYIFFLSGKPSSSGSKKKAAPSTPQVCSLSVFWGFEICNFFYLLACTHSPRPALAPRRLTTGVWRSTSRRRRSPPSAHKPSDYLPRDFTTPRPGLR